MAKSLLIETSDFKLNRADITRGDKYIVMGILGRANDINHNERIYKRNILENALSLYKKTYIAENRAMGELDHPDSEIINLQSVSHNVLDAWWEGDEIIGKIEILDTPCGDILKKLFDAGITVGISSRGLGSVKEIEESNRKVAEVQDDFEIIAWDFVSNPSTKGGYMFKSKLKENKSYNIMHQADEYFKLNQIINSILRGE